MADTNLVSLKIAAEGSPGVIETTNEMVSIPFTGTSDMGATPETVVSDVIRSDRQVSDLIKVNETVGGSFDTELIPAAFDTILEGVFQSSWVGTDGGDTIFSAGSAVTPSRIDTVNTRIITISPTFSAAMVGEQLRVRRAGVDYFVTVYNFVSATTIDVYGADLPTSANSATSIKRPRRLVNGVIPKTYTVERTFGGTSVFEYLKGMEFDTFSLSASAGSLVTASFGMLGREHVSQNTRAGVTDSVAESYASAFNAASNVGRIGEGASGLTVVTDISLEISNNLRERNVLGVVGASSIGSGEFNVTGSLSVYFEDNVLLEKLLNNTQTSLSFSFASPEGEMLYFHLPAIKFSEGIPEVSGKNEDVMLNLGFQAFAAGGAGTTLSVQTMSAAT